MNKNMILLTPYMVSLIKNCTPFIVFYNNDQLLEGSEVYEYEKSNPVLKGGLKGYWDEKNRCYCLKEG